MGVGLLRGYLASGESFGRVFSCRFVSQDDFLASPESLSVTRPMFIGSSQRGV